MEFVQWSDFLLMGFVFIMHKCITKCSCDIYALSSFILDFLRHVDSNFATINIGLQMQGNN